MKQDTFFDEKISNEEEEYPLIGKELDGIYTAIKLIGGGGACQVYQARMNAHKYKAREIIKGNLPPVMLALSHSELNLPPEFKGEITDPLAISKIQKRAEMLSTGLEQIIENEKIKESNSRDTSRIIHQKQMQTLDAGFRAVGNIVALKVLRRGRSKNDNTVQRFDTEAQTTRIYNHINLVKSIDGGKTIVANKTGSPEELHYFVMEYIDPYDLDQHTEKEPVSEQLATEILKGVLNACAYLHEKGTVHRDIKPNNILIDTNSVLEFILGREKLDVRLADLGLAKVNTAEIESDSADLATRMQTQEGLILGTPNYMSPEQIETPREIGTATDIWSLAATIYYLQTGHFPFGNENDAPFSIMADIKTLSPPKKIREYNPKVHSFLEDIIMLNFTRVTPEKNKITVKTEDGQEKEIDGEAKRDEKGLIVYASNNRLTAEEFLLAIQDYEKIKASSHTEKETADMLKKTNEKGEKSEEKSMTLLEMLNTLEKNQIKRKNHNPSIIEKRIELLEKAASYTLNSTRKAYLNKMLIYEQKQLSKQEETAPAIKNQNQQSSLGKKAVLIGAAGFALLGALFGGIKISTHLERIATYKKIKTDLLENAKKEISDGNFDAAQEFLKQSRTELGRLPKGYGELNNIISHLEQSLIESANKKRYSTASALIETAYECLKQKKLSEAQSKTDEAKKQNDQINFQGLQTEKKNLEAKITDLNTLLSAKRGAIKTYEFVKEECQRLQGEYELLKKDSEDGSPYPEKNKIEQIIKNIESRESMLAGIAEDFFDNNFESPEYTALSTNLATLKKSTYRTAILIAKEKLKLLQTSISEIPKNQPAGNLQENEIQARQISAAIEELISLPGLQSAIKEEYLPFSEIKKQTDRDLEHYSELGKQAEKGNALAKEIILLEARTKYPEKQMNIRNGITSETIKEYTNKAEKYLNGEDMRADIYLHLTLTELIKKIKPHSEEIKNLLENAGPVFSASWKIQQLNSALDENPENLQIQEDLKQAAVLFAEKTLEIKKQFSALNCKLEEYIGQGKKIPNPYDLVALGDAYTERENNTKALEAYQKSIVLFYLGFPADKKTILHAINSAKDLKPN